jgi:hypothetical protein
VVGVLAPGGVALTPVFNVFDDVQLAVVLPGSVCK